MLTSLQQFSVDEFKCQDLVYLEGEVAPAASMRFENSFHTPGTQVRPASRLRRKQHVLHPWAKLVAVPNSKVMELVSADKEPFEVKCRERMIDPGNPLRHTIVIRIFCFERELVIPVMYSTDRGNRSRSDTAIGLNS